MVISPSVDTLDLVTKYFPFISVPKPKSKEFSSPTGPSRLYSTSQATANQSFNWW